MKYRIGTEIIDIDFNCFKLPQIWTIYEELDTKSSREKSSIRIVKNLNYDNLYSNIDVVKLDSTYTTVLRFDNDFILLDNGWSKANILVSSSEASINTNVMSVILFAFCPEKSYPAPLRYH